MNRYPLWKNLLICAVLLIGLLYTLPNFYGEIPAVQISAARATVKIDSSTEARVVDILKTAGIKHGSPTRDETGLRVPVEDTDTQLRAKDTIEHALNPDARNPAYIVALNLLPATPDWLASLNARPMSLGLDLRGGIHFLLQVDVKHAVDKQIEGMEGSTRTALREKNIRHAGIRRAGDNIEVLFRDAETRQQARRAIEELRPGQLQYLDSTNGAEFLLSFTLTPQARLNVQGDAVRQNISTLHNRINELGVAEPVIQQQGPDRIVVQLPGVQDPARAKDIIGRTATLQVRMALEPGQPATSAESFPSMEDGVERQVQVRREVILTGEHFVGATPGTDSQTQFPIVSVNLDSVGGGIMRKTTRENLKKPMAILLFEKGRGEVISVATIQGEFGERFQISGRFSPEETNRLALLIRAGSLAAPMDFIEERTIGPALGKANIEKGFNATLWGFVAIAVFMCIYYMLVGLISSIALGANLLLLIALLSMLQATLTLPGIAAIALTLGMAIDANVLVNERIREELRNGATAHAAIEVGYGRAFDTILDSNITTLIAGLALLVFGSGPVKGFAVVHCLGILTSMFSAVLVSRMLVNFVYGYRRKLDSISIGQIWKPV